MIDCSLCWGVVIYVGYEVVRGFGDELDSDVGNKFSKVFELEVVG